jgi:hypothetical protein
MLFIKAFFQTNARSSPVEEIVLGRELTELNPVF